MAPLLFARGERERTLELARSEWELTRGLEPRWSGVAMRSLGVVTGGDEGIDLLREAVRLLAGPQARVEHASSLVELGSALRRANHRADAREPLREGMGLATQCGGLALAAHAREELLATGARPRRSALRGVAALTPASCASRAWPPRGCRTVRSRRACS